MSQSFSHCPRESSSRQPVRLIQGISELRFSCEGEEKEVNEGTIARLAVGPPPPEPVPDRETSLFGLFACGIVAYRTVTSSAAAVPAASLPWSFPEENPDRKSLAARTEALSRRETPDKFLSSLGRRYGLLVPQLGAFISATRRFFFLTGLTREKNTTPERETRKD